MIKHMLTFSLCGLLTATCGQIMAQKKASKPNIVFLFVDDLGYADVGFNGSIYYETPAMDKLARESLVLENSYTYPTCSPSRAALLTGQQSFRTGVYTVPVLEKGDNTENIFSRWTIDKSYPLYAEPLAAAGYKAIHLGKWHIVGPDPINELQKPYPFKEKLKQPNAGNFDWVALAKSKGVQQFYPEGRGFVKNVGGTFRGDPAFEFGGYESTTKGYRAPFSNPFISPKPNDEWLTDRLTNEAIEFMDENKDGPFFVNLHFYAVHRPTTARSKALVKHFLSKPGDSVLGQGVGKKREEMANYATMIASLDQNIQRIVDYLDKNGLRENTMLILSSDNGYNDGTSSNNLMRDAKGYIYEGGIRVPTIINWPDKITPRRSEAPVSLLDYFPTFLDVAGIKNYKGKLDGNSMTALFKEDSKIFTERPIFWQVSSQYKHGTCSAIRYKEYKLIQFLANGTIELYNLENDPKEEHNLASQELEVVHQLLTSLVNWREANHVPLPSNAVVK
ncbi:sulfatase [Sphingobacterium arenae]|uniref:Sulfatase n=1 Tax=Sphingobacterium arenae TaxID=1280598 RepID=A0ABR7XYN3_9SPHI|nr:sulfatase [Sphingobacterium arenae]MBD1424164.1 sulfatase [Sphingobacterium arenae]